MSLGLFFSPPRGKLYCACVNAQNSPFHVLCYVSLKYFVFNPLLFWYVGGQGHENLFIIRKLLIMICKLRCQMVSQEMWV